MTNFHRLVPFLAALAGPGFLCAQTSDGHWCTVDAGGGYSAVAGKDGSNLSGRWDLEAGVGFGVHYDPKRSWNFFLDVDYLFDETSVKSSALDLAKNLNPTNIALLNATGGKARFNAVAFDPTFQVRASDNI